MGGFGPAIPLLQADQGTSGAVAGLHGTALGLASIVAGTLNSRVVHRFGQYKSAWLGIATFLIGAVCFVTFPNPYQTITSIFIAGIGVSIAIANTITYLAGHYGDHAPRAVSQNNAITSAFNLVGTITIGLIAATTVSWRLGLLACVPFAVLLYLFMGRNHSPEHIPDESGHQRGPMSRAFWLSWVGLIFTISTEFALIFWSSALIRERTELSPALSTTLVFAFTLGMLIGRWFGNSIRPELGIDTRLKFVLVLQLLGFFILWAGTIPLVSFLGLLLAGLGTSMQFTLTTLRLLNFSSGKNDQAMGLNILASGFAIAGSPFLLGAIADQVGIAKAFLIVPIFNLVALTVVNLVPVKEAK